MRRAALAAALLALSVAPALAGNTTQKTGKQATQDPGVYCQDWPGQSSRPSYPGTGPQTPCGLRGPAPAPAQRPPLAVDACTKRQAPPYRTVFFVHDLAQIVFDNYQNQPIFIARITNLPNSYLVALSGTQVVMNRLQQTTGLGEDMLSSLNLRDAYSRSVIREMGAYNSGRGVPQGASVYLVGHSLGGMVAQNLAASGDFTARWTVRRVVTLGSPRTVDLPTGIVRRFAAIGDPIPQLSPAAWDLGGFNLSNQIWVDNAVPPNEAGNPIAPHLHYPDSRDLGSYDALGERTNVQQVRNIFVLDPASQEYCPSQVL